MSALDHKIDFVALVSESPERGISPLSAFGDERPEPAFALLFFR